MLENGGDIDTLHKVDVYMGRYNRNYIQMFDDLQKSLWLFGDIDHIPMESKIESPMESLTESVIVPYGDNFDDDDDGYDGTSVSAV